ncbi:MAG: FCD domain-containing protein [Thermoguttaceae bacterium]|jgi:GntR family transcriptional repressor for pyruvate dehydrogenase complex
MKDVAKNRIHRETLSDLVVAKIKDYILDHALGEGDRLPTEQQMADMFGVSRVSVREATKSLSFLGIIQSAPRRGLTIGQVDMERVTEYLGFHFALNNYPRRQLLKARIVIETGALAEAMERVAGDPAVCGRLAEINEALGRAATPDEFIAGDLAFHRELLQASQIEPLVAFNSLLEVFFRRFREEVIEEREHWAQGVKGHGQILAALQARDLQKAQNLLFTHLDHYRGHV